MPFARAIRSPNRGARNTRRWPQTRAPASKVPRAHATVLWVDDDEGVRGFGSLVLRSQGYQVLEAGDAFYLPPGHIPLAEAGSEIVQFSPAEQLREVSDVMKRNMAAMQGA